MIKATLEQWRMFKAVAEAGGFNQAAQAVHKSQSSIHHAVHKLEQALGIALFENDGRRVRLTDAGTLMLRRARFLLDEAHKVEAVAASLQHGTETQLRVAADIILPPEMLYRVLNAVSDEYPLLRIEIMETVLSGANDLLRQGKADIAISPFALDNGFSEHLCEIEFLLVAHPDHPLHQYQRVLTSEDLKSYRQIVVRDSSSEKRADAGWLGAEQRWTVSHTRTSIDMIKRGLGYAWLPVAMIQESLDEGSLAPLPVEHGGQRRALLNLCFEDGDRLGPAARTFIGELRFQSMQLPGTAVVFGIDD